MSEMKDKAIDDANNNPQTMADWAPERYILSFPDKRLLTVCEELVYPLTDEFQKDLQDILPAMLEVCLSYRGIGLAANQVGITKRFFLMCPNKSLDGYYFCFNPKILNKGRDMIKSMEGCLSAPGVLQEKMRHRVIDVEYLDLENNVIRKTLKGKEAYIYAHELSHINGEPFVDEKITVEKT